MIAYERGYFQMDDLVEKYLPEFADAQVFVGGSADDPQLEPAVNMTIKHLFTHTAGLNGGQNEAGKMQARIMREHGPPKDLEEYSKLVAKAPLLAQPGDLWHYASGLTILGRCIEVWSGKSFDVFCEEYLFAPLGMVDTGFKSQRTATPLSSRLSLLCLNRTPFLGRQPCLPDLALTCRQSPPPRSSAWSRRTPSAARAR